MQDPAVDSIDRDHRIDFFRGLALLIIFIDHVRPNFWHAYTLQRFAFFDAAEAFVLISGYVIGLVYTRTFQAGGVRACAAKAATRCRLIYCWHLALVVGTGLLIYGLSIAGIGIDSPVLRDLVRSPWETVVETVALLYSPDLLGILPLYIILTGMTPVAIYCAEKHHTWLLAVSLSLYAAAQLMPVRRTLPEYSGMDELLQRIRLAVGVCHRNCAWKLPLP